LIIAPFDEENSSSKNFIFRTQEVSGLRFLRNPFFL
jgi:hypothetical protein